MAGTNVNVLIDRSIRKYMKVKEDNSKMARRNKLLMKDREGIVNRDLAFLELQRKQIKNDFERKQWQTENLNDYYQAPKIEPIKQLTQLSFTLSDASDVGSSAATMESTWARPSESVIFCKYHIHSGQTCRYFPCISAISTSTLSLAMPEPSKTNLVSDHFDLNSGLQSLGKKLLSRQERLKTLMQEKRKGLEAPMDRTAIALLKPDKNKKTRKMPRFQRNI